MGEGRLNDRASQLRQEDKALSLRQLGAAYGLGLRAPQANAVVAWIPPDRGKGNSKRL
jgi:hypothetical protein